ncbi:sugar kinase [Bacillaceae bacterium SIJ1]|uniref:sugar kinase n=1 Tax=Litoribacterium kuwaitense TaxID=1398745 RepID=UPI0013ED7EB8|nr:sugar kinase [Litoribacterium kuwaitense]NGP44832.1 sugar kinase [Litoribacterium kuwaitense]
MPEIITIGDAMVTMNPLRRGPLRFSDTFERTAGGAELNVAIGCARLGLSTGWISRLGKDEFGRYLKHFAQGEGIDMSHVSFSQHAPTSVNFKEINEDGSGRTFYYRHPSPITSLKANDIADRWFGSAQIFHMTGVYPAIHPEHRAVMMELLKKAKAHGVTVVMDPNIRLKLWDADEAKETLTSFLPYVDVLLTGDEEGELLFETQVPEEIAAQAQAYGIHTVAVKMGAQGSFAKRKDQQHYCSARKPRKIVDTVGAGDGFDAGFIYGLLKGLTLEETLTFANTIGSMVVSVSGDNEGLPYLEDVLAILNEEKTIER